MANSKKNKIAESNNDFSSDAEEREEHIRTLEQTVQYLKNELDSVKSQLAQKSESIQSGTVSSFEKLAAELIHCKNEIELSDRTHSIFSKYYSVIESNFYLKSDSNEFQPLSNSQASSYLDRHIEHLEEQGILDWVFEENALKIIPNLEASVNKQSSLIIYPIFELDKPIGVFLASTIMSHTSFDNEIIGTLSNSLGIICNLALSMVILREKTMLQRKFEIINNQLMHTSLLMSVGEIAGTVSREMENPIKIIQANNDLIRRGIGSVQRRSEIISENLDRVLYLNTIIKELVFDDTAEPEIVSINKLIIDTIDILKFQISNEDIRLSTEFDKGDFLVECHKSQMQHVLLNLFLNARDAMPNGGKLSIGCFRQGEKKISISIADTGEGIPEKDFPNIFEPHFTKKTGSKKLALNLYMTKLIINRHKGKISFVSEQGKGSTFKIILPIAKY